METIGIKCPTTGKVITNFQTGEPIKPHDRVSFIRTLGEETFKCEGRVTTFNSIYGYCDYLGQRHSFNWEMRNYKEIQTVAEEIHCPNTGQVIRDWHTERPIKFGDKIKFNDYVSVVRLATCEGTVKENEFLEPYVDGFYMEDGYRTNFEWKLLGIYSAMRKIDY